MKFFTAKYLSLALLAYAYVGTISATHYADADDQSCCRSYECSCNPLYCGAFDLQLHGGVEPILWRQRGPILGINCLITGVPSAPLFTLFDEVAKFRTFFKTPWTIGGQVGHAWSDNTRVYLEFDYAQAHAKSDVLLSTDFIVPGATAVPITFNFNKYKLFEFYAGARYYFDRWCDKVSFFLGAKVGLVHHKSNELILTFTSVTPVVVTPAATVFTSNTSISGGADFGLDICFCGNWSLVITGAVLASCGPDAVASLTLPGTVGILGFTTALPAHIGTELRFPVTVGVRYSF